VLDRCADLKLPVFHLAGNGERRVLEFAGGLRLCHGSPRSDIELPTGLTGDDRLREATTGVDEAVVVHGHTHVQYRRQAIGKVITGAGSVGLPYAAGPGARWALISDEVRLVVTPYNLDRAEALIAATGYPADAYLKTLRQPPGPDAKTADAEKLVFSN
jgi:diadenosine tetraphosphatase ApaH/serine/threonine PP2A family protein phosphatase